MKILTNLEISPHTVGREGRGSAAERGAEETERSGDAKRAGDLQTERLGGERVAEDSVSVGQGRAAQVQRGSPEGGGQGNGS